MDKNAFVGDDGIDWCREARMQIKRGMSSQSINSTTFDHFIKHIPENALCLDLGCNIGRWTPVFKSYGLRYEGLDPSLTALKIAREYFPDETYYHLNAKEMKFAEKYDLVFTNAVLQHIARPNQQIIFGNIFRALKSGGHLVIQEMSTKESQTHHTVEIWQEIAKSVGFKVIDFVPPHTHIFRKLG